MEMLCQKAEAFAYGMRPSPSPRHLYASPNTKSVRKRQKGRALESKLISPEDNDEEVVCKFNPSPTVPMHFSQLEIIGSGNHGIDEIKKESLRVHRRHLQEDVSRLQKQLHDEMCLHSALKSALTCGVGVLPNISYHAPSPANELLADVAVLEASIGRLEEQIVSLHWELIHEQTERRIVESTLARSVDTCENETDLCDSHPSNEIRRLSSLSFRLDAYQEALTMVRSTSESTPQNGSSGADAGPASTSNSGQNHCVQSDNNSPHQFEYFVRTCSVRQASVSNHTLDVIQEERLVSNCTTSSIGLVPKTPSRDREKTCDRMVFSPDGTTQSSNSTRHCSPWSSSSDEGILHCEDDKIGRKLATLANIDMGANLQKSSYSIDLMKSERRRKKVKQKLVFPIHMHTPDHPDPVHWTSERCTINDLCQQPNSLSEQMLQCMIDIYCHLSGPGGFLLKTSNAPSLASPTSPFGQAGSSDLSSTSETSLLSVGRSPLVDLRNQNDVMGTEKSFDPYRTREKLPWADMGVYRLAREVTHISANKEQLEYAAAAFRKYRLLVAQLSKVKMGSMKHSEKLAFWINLYNALMMHAFLAYGVPKSEHKVYQLMQKACYIVGSHSFSALAIEYALLKGRPPAYRPQIALFLALHKVKLSEEQSKFAIDYPEPLTMFALCCGVRSSPGVRIYNTENVHEQLEASLHDYICASVGLSLRGKLQIPKLVYLYARDFVEDMPLLDWICQHLPTSQVVVVRECVQQRKQRYLSFRDFVILPFDFGFRYLFLPETLS